MDRFGLSEQYYSFGYSNTFVLVMSTETEYKEDSDQYDFVEESLENASSDSSIDWIIVTMYRPRVISTVPPATSLSPYHLDLL